MYRSAGPNIHFKNFANYFQGTFAPKLKLPNVQVKKILCFYRRLPKEATGEVQMKQHLTIPTTFHSITFLSEAAFTADFFT